MWRLLLFVLPAVTYASITVELKGTIHLDVVSSFANSKGFDERVIEEQHKALFGIQNEGLFQVIDKFNGKRPDEVYTTSETPYGDLYERFGWKQVRVKIQPQLKDIYVGYKTDTVKLSKTKYENKNSRPKNTLINENGYLNNSIYSFWTQPQKIKGGNETINFSFDIENHNAIFKKTFALGLDSKYIDTLYYEINATIILEPGQTVTAELEALRRTVKIEIPYDVSLSGDVIAKYNQMYKDRYFFKFDINDLLKANNMTTTGYLHQTLMYIVLNDAQIHLFDAADVIVGIIPAEVTKKSGGGKKAMNKHDDKVKGIPMKIKNTSFDIPDGLDLK